MIVFIIHNQLALGGLIAKSARRETKGRAHAIPARSTSGAEIAQSAPLWPGPQRSVGRRFDAKWPAFICALVSGVQPGQRQTAKTPERVSVFGRRRALMCWQPAGRASWYCVAHRPRTQFTWSREIVLSARARIWTKPARLGVSGAIFQAHTKSELQLFRNSRCSGAGIGAIWKWTLEASFGAISHSRGVPRRVQLITRNWHCLSRPPPAHFAIPTRPNPFAAHTNKAAQDQKRLGARSRRSRTLFEVGGRSSAERGPNWCQFTAFRVLRRPVSRMDCGRDARSAQAQTRTCLQLELRERCARHWRQSASADQLVVAV